VGVNGVKTNEIGPRVAREETTTHAIVRLRFRQFFLLALAARVFSQHSERLLNAFATLPLALL